MDALRSPIGSDDAARLGAFGLIAACFVNVDDSSQSELMKGLIEDAPFETEPELPGYPDNAAMCFYLWVRVPCWLVHGVFPTENRRVH